MTHHSSCCNCFIILHAYYTRNSSLHWLHTIEQKTHTHTHTQDTTLNAGYGSLNDWYLILPSMHLPQHWIPSSLHSTVHITPLLPPFTPYIIAWHSHYTHHPALLLISQTHNHSQLHLSLNTPSLTTQHSTSNKLNTQSTAWLSEYAACSSLLDCLPLGAHTIFYFPSLHDYFIPHSRISFHNRRDPRLYTILHTMYVCNPAHHSNTADT